MGRWTSQRGGRQADSQARAGWNLVGWLELPTRVRAALIASHTLRACGSHASAAAHASGNQLVRPFPSSSSCCSCSCCCCCTFPSQSERSATVGSLLRGYASLAPILRRRAPSWARSNVVAPRAVGECGRGWHSAEPAPPVCGDGTRRPRCPAQLFARATEGHEQLVRSSCRS